QLLCGTGTALPRVTRGDEQGAIRAPLEVARLVAAGRLGGHAQQHLLRGQVDLPVGEGEAGQRVDEGLRLRVVKVDVGLAVVEVRIDLDPEETVLDVRRIGRGDLRDLRGLPARGVVAEDLPGQLDDPDV